MKQIIDNKYIKAFRFSSSNEASAFYNNQKTHRSLYLDNTFGENYYCYVCYNALTMESQFVLSFRSDERNDNLNFLFWDDLFVLDTGRDIFLIDKNMAINKALEITSPLIGFYILDNKNLLILEEAYMRIIDYEGQLIRSELFDLIEEFSINDNLLSIKTSEGNKVFDLIG